MSPAKWRPFSPDLNVLNESNYTMGQVHITSVLAFCCFIHCNPFGPIQQTPHCKYTALQWHRNSYIFIEKIQFKMSSAKWWPCCFGLNVLNDSNYTMGQVHITSVLNTNSGILLFHSLQSIWPNTANTTLYNTLYNHNIQHCNGIGTTQIIYKTHHLNISILHRNDHRMILKCIKTLGANTKRTGNQIAALYDTTISVTPCLCTNGIMPISLTMPICNASQG